MKRKYYFLIIMLLSVIYFCGGRPTEIADRIMIHAIGIDPTDSGYRVTLQIFTPEASGSDTAIDPSKPNVTVVTGDGATVNDAMRTSFGKLGGNVFIGKNQIVMFGRDINLSKKEDIFGFFLSSSETFLNVDCAVAENTAEEILKIPIPGNTVTSEKYPQMIEAAAENGRCIKTTFMDLLNGMESNDSAVIMPVFSMSDSDSGNSGAENAQQSEDSETSEEALPEAKLCIESGAVFVGGKFAGEISCEQMGFAAVLNGSGDYVRTDITQKGRDLSRTFKVKSKEVGAEIADSEIIFHVKCTLEPKDTQLFSELSDVDETNGEAVGIIGEKMQEFANLLCTDFSSELINSADLLKRYFPNIYRDYSGNTQELYQHVKFEIALE